MNDVIKWLLRFMVQGVFWVFVLSISWEGRSLFARVSDVLVHNALVAAADEGLADGWQRLSRAAKMTFANPTPSAQKPM